MATDIRGQNSDKMTHVQFFKACDVLKKNRQVFLSERPSRVKTAEMLTRMCGFPVTYATIGKIQEATGVKWKVSPSRTAVGTHARHAQIRVLADAMIILFSSLGVDPPQELLDILVSYRPNGVHQEEQPEEPAG